MFVRGKWSAQSAPGGLGIGLTLAKTLVEMHGGTIAVKSDGANRGSEFTIILPIASPQAETRRTEVDRDSKQESRHSTMMRILIVEDNADAREMLSDALASKGHEVRTASDGPAAFHILEEWQPDVALLDIGLPGMTGHDVARRVRANPHLRHVALVALTGWGQEKDRQLSADSGIDHHLTKPVDPEQLERVLEAVVRH
jgi:CheY-like chemotaxis protein